MSPTRHLSPQTRRNWAIDAALFAGAVAAAITGIYFLYLPSGGYQGGRNPLYGVTILFDRHTWDLIHTWGGAVMIGVALTHLMLHWSWVVTMAKRVTRAVGGKGVHMTRFGVMNVVLNLAVAVSFALAAISGIYFMFDTGNRWASDPMFLFSRTTWDMIHTWAGSILIGAAVVHFAIHWKWVTKVTQSMWQSIATSVSGASLRLGGASAAARRTEV